MLRSIWLHALDRLFDLHYMRDFRNRLNLKILRQVLLGIFDDYLGYLVQSSTKTLKSWPRRDEAQFSSEPFLRYLRNYFDSI